MKELVSVLGTNIDITSGINQVYTIGLIISIGIIVVGGVILFMFIARFKHKIRIREVVHNKKICIDDKFRKLTDRDGNVWFQCLKTKMKLPVAPADVIDTDTRGRMVVECYTNASGDYSYIIDRGNIKNIPTEILEIKDISTRKKKVIEWRDANNIVDSFQPLTTNQRTLLITQIRKAEARRTTSWKDHIVMITSIAALVILVVSLMIFWGDIAKPVLEGKELTLQLIKQLNEMKQIDLNTQNSIQAIKADNNPDTNNEPPS